MVKVEEKEGSETSSGLLLASSVKGDRPSVGVVKAVGPGRIAADGSRILMEVEAGDSVKFRDFQGNEITIGGEEYSCVRGGEVLAKYR